MAKYRQTFVRGDVFPASFVDALQEFLGSAALNFQLVQVDNVTIKVPGGAGNGGDDQVAVAIDGLWRYNTADASAAHPGGAAAQYDVFVTTGDNVFSNSPNPDTDTTDYTFGLSIKAQSTFPSQPHYRKVGEVTWDGTKITAITPFVNSVGIAKHAPTHGPTGSDPLPVDQAAGVGSVRTLGAGALQAVAGNDPRIPTQNENDALVGTTGAPSSANKFVTDTDARLANTRAPSAHGASHQPGGSDAIDYSTVNLWGTLAARPSPTTALKGVTYLATDDHGGQHYVCTGSAWLALGAPVAVQVSTAPQYVTLTQFAALTPADAMEVYVILDATMGAVQHFRYNASDASAYKWQAVGETTLFARTQAPGIWDPPSYPHLQGISDTGFLTTIGSYTGPSLVIPRNGEYYVKFGGHGFVNVSAARGWMSLSGAGLVPDAAELVAVFPALYAATVYKVRRLTLTAGTLSTVYRAYHTFAGQLAALYAQDRTLEVVPIRIS